MGNPVIKATVGTYQYFDGTSTEFAGAEAGLNFKKGYLGTGLSAATDGFKGNPYGLWDIKGKSKYNKYLDSNVRIRTAFDGNEVKSTQVRVSPLTVNVPVSKNVSIYSNTHYSGKYKYKSGEWKHSMGNFTGVGVKINDYLSAEAEFQRYNLQDIKDDSGNNWGFNALLTYKF